MWIPSRGRMIAFTLVPCSRVPEWRAPVIRPTLLAPVVEERFSGRVQHLEVNCDLGLVEE